MWMLFWGEQDIIVRHINIGEQINIKDNVFLILFRVEIDDSVDLSRIEIYYLPTEKRGSSDWTILDPIPNGRGEYWFTICLGEDLYTISLHPHLDNLRAVCFRDGYEEEEFDSYHTDD